jgi:hypothetical protein
MKYLAAILLFYFSSLIAQPMVTLVHNGMTKEKLVCTMACCQKYKAPEKKQAQKLPFGCCANDMSNPFAQCCCCIGFIPAQQNMGLTILPNYTIISFIDSGSLLPNYSSDCWRPPKMAA